MFHCPQVRFWIEWLTCTDNNAQAVEVVSPEILGTKLHKHAHCGRCGKHLGDAIFLHNWPGDARIGIIWRAFPYQDSRAVGPWTINHRWMSNNPANIGHTPVDVILFEVERQSCVICRPNHIATVDIQTALGCPCWARCIENKERVFRLHYLGITRSWLWPAKFVKIDFTAAVQRNCRCLTPVNYDLVDDVESLYCLINDIFQWGNFASTIANICRNHHPCLCIFYTWTKCAASQAGIDYRVDCPQPRTCQHGGDSFGCKW